MEILCFFAGIAFVFIKNAYPLFFLIIVLCFRANLVLVGCFLGGVLWGVLHQWWVVGKGMPHDEVIKRVVLQGYVASIPTQTARKIQFQFLANRFNGQLAKTKLLLTCYDHCPHLHVGQYWQLTAKIKKPRNLRNPGGFDYVNWLNVRHIDWVGYVRRGTFQLISEKGNHYPLLQLREKLASRLAQIDPDEKTLGILQALTLGVTNHIDKGEWELFRRTGTIHLMVISGAHIGLVAGLSYWLVKWLWSRSSRLCLRYPAQKTGSFAALFMAVIYAALAGFAVPAQRALIVCFFLLLRNFCKQRFSVWQAWRYALAGVLLFEPHSVLMPGFYLSFIAVGVLLLVNQYFPWKGIRKTIVMQIGCLLGLMPLTLFWFSYGAVNGLVANLVAIPWVGFIIIPLSLFVLLIGQWFAIPWIVGVLKLSIMLLLYVLKWVDSFAVFNLSTSLTQILPVFALMVAMSIMVFLPLRSLFPAAGLLVIAGMFPGYERVKVGDARVDVLDVGQGLAIVIQTAKHVLVYDTGVKFFQGSDMGKLAIIPYLNTLGIQHLDKVIISHSDLDHRGGLVSLEKKYKIGELIVDNPSFYRRGVSCHQYPAWSWDGVSFRFFAINKKMRGKNNHSCVLQMTALGGQVLLSGDIEKSAETYLIQTYGDKLKSSIMLVPHHGSKTSSSLSFIEQVSPRYAIVSYGFDNRYRFPHPEGMLAYKQRQVPVYNTVDCGMVSVVLKNNGVSKPSCLLKL